MTNSGNTDELFKNDMKESKDELFKNAMEDKWDNIVEAYKKYPGLHSAKITKSENTALHIAVAYGQKNAVERLVQEIKDKKICTIQSLTNDRKETPLHVAAKLGRASICYLMAEKEPELIKATNCQGETPLFLAALHGMEDAFLRLYELYTEKGQKEILYTLCRRSSDGNTILHAAISGEYFSLAYQIIQCFPNLVSYVNEIGWSPLHTLASKPTSFYSGSVLRWSDRVIYSCIIVQELGKEQIGTRLARQTRKLMSSLTKHFKDEERQPQQSNPQPNRGLPTQDDSEVFMESKNNSNDEESQRQQSNPQLNNRRNQPQRELKRQHAFHHLPRKVPRFFKPLIDALIFTLGMFLGISKIHEIVEEKRKHTWANQIVELMYTKQDYQYDDTGRKPYTSSLDEYPFSGPEYSSDLPPYHEISQSTETPMVIAAKMGVTEIVERTADKFPVSIDDMDSDGKNIVLLAVEHRQLKVYNLLRNMLNVGEGLFYHLDKEGNSALHLAAKLGEFGPWFIPGETLQLQWEMKWFEFVKSSMSPRFFTRCNNKGETPLQIFTETHKGLVSNGREWLIKTSESCSVVAALIATVAFATSVTIPGSYEAGKATLEDRPAFTVFSISSLVALCSSGTALVLFLAILTSRIQEKDFAINLPRKLLFAMTSLFTSIASIFVSFCAAHFFILKDRFRHMAFLMYAVTCLPVTIFGLEQLGLYYDLLWAICFKEPQFGITRRSFF